MSTGVARFWNGAQWVLPNAPGPVGPNGPRGRWNVLTQDEYDALATKSPSQLYFIADIVGPYRDEVLTDNPVAYYRLNSTPYYDETGGPVAQDNGEVDPVQPSILPNGDGLSARFKSTTSAQSWIEVPDIARTRIGGGPISIEFWGREEPSTPVSDRTPIHGGAQNAWVVILDDGNTMPPPGANSGSLLTVRAFVGGSTAIGLGLSSANRIDRGRSFHCVIVRDAIRAQVFINGIEMGDHGGGQGGTTNRASVSPWYIGYQNKFAGRLQEVALYDYGLTEEQINRHYRAGSQPVQREQFIGVNGQAGLVNMNLPVHLPGDRLFLVVRSPSGTGQTPPAPTGTVPGWQTAILTYSDTQNVGIYEAEAIATNHTSGIWTGSNYLAAVVYRAANLPGIREAEFAFGPAGATSLEYPQSYVSIPGRSSGLRISATATADAAAHVAPPGWTNRFVGGNFVGVHTIDTLAADTIPSATVGPFTAQNGPIGIFLEIGDPWL